MNVFEDDNINCAVQEHSKELLKEARKYLAGTELGAVIELDNVNKISSDGFLHGADGGFTVSIPKCKSPGVTIHNHPSGETFSVRDIHKFGADTYASAMYVVGNNGKCYALKKNSNFNDCWSKLTLKITQIEFGLSGHSVNDILSGAEEYGLKYYEK